MLIENRPIIFTGPMIRAIRAGRKTETRRIVKWPKEFDGAEPLEDQLDNLGDYVTVVATDRDGKQHFVECPYGDEGDLLYIRETFAPSEYAKNGFLYRADGDLKMISWTPAIHMPREAVRLWLAVTDHPDLERLSAVTDEAALAEGIVERGVGLFGLPEWETRDCLWSPRSAYLRLFRMINDLGEHANPWVWVPRFRLCS